MSFDRIAPHYRWMEAVLAGKKLQVCRTTHLCAIEPPQSILILGEGNGRFLTKCVEAFPKASVTCVDASTRMLSLARHRLQSEGRAMARVQFIHADARMWKPPASTFDLVVTHFFLDCFPPEQLKSLIAAMAIASTSVSKWLLADFQIPEKGAARFRARIIHRLMYGFFRLVTRLPARSLTSPEPYLTANGFWLKKRTLSDFGLLHSDLWARG